MATLYERLGADAAITALAEILYERIYNEEALAPFFKDVQKDEMEKKQFDFLSDIFDGPKLDRTVDLRAVHKPLVERGLSEEHFNLVARHVKDILEAMNVAEADVSEAMEAILAYKDDVLNT